MPNIVLKASEACNSHCKYCEVVARKEPKVISLALQNIIFSKINDYLIANPEESITILWHGGEPLLLGTEFYQEVIRQIETTCQTTKSRIKHNIQSNLTLLTPDFLDHFRKLNISAFGTSFEPIEGIRCGGSLGSSENYNKHFIESTKVLEENGFGWGFIYVATKASLAQVEELFYFCTNFNVRCNFNIHPVTISGDDSNNLALTDEEWGTFLGETFTIWWKHKDRFPEVEPFRTFVSIYTEDARDGGCQYTGSCAYDHLYIGPNGQTSQCGKAGDMNAVDYGNIVDHTLEELMNHPSRKIFVDRPEILASGECNDCRFWDICRGGCPMDAYSKHHEFNKRPAFCDATKIFLECYFEPVTGMKRDFYKN